MRTLIRFFLLALVSTSVFSANLVFALDFVEELTQGSMAMFTGLPSKEAKGLSLVLFEGDDSGMYNVGETSKSYRLKDNILELGGMGEYKLSKECENGECTLYLRDFYGNIVYSFIKAPPGLDLFVEARNLAKKEEGSEKELVKLLKQALLEASTPKFFSRTLVRGADIIIYKVSGWFLAGDYFKEARDGFLSIGEKGMAAECAIQLVINGGDIEDLNVEETALLALKPLYEDQHGIALRLGGLESIAYFCAKQKRPDLAEKYQARAVNLAKKHKASLFGGREMRDAKIWEERLANLVFTYKVGQLPDTFVLSILEE